MRKEAKENNQIGYSKDIEARVMKFIQDLKDTHAKTQGINFDGMYLSNGLRWR